MISLMPQFTQGARNIMYQDNFEQAFSTVSVNTKRKKELVKYIILKLENQIAGRLSTRRSNCTIEHILPENPRMFGVSHSR
ncbi:MAG: DUF1524 domain-containing protein [Ignavibacteria bacterium]|nr:DUF1524 domain-containing protein [Ignavibacteria bacterium]